MNDPELALLSTWRFTRVIAGDKIPYPAKWETNHLPLYAIPQTDNIGVVLGEASGGLMALDFDGPTSWTWFNDNIGCDLPDTVIWKSGKEDRCQMAFTIPKEYWPYIRTKKITTKPGDKSIGLKPEQMEFRWNGLQSVLPPSTHPEHALGYTYEWLNSPTKVKVAELPEAILSWLLLSNIPVAKQVAPTSQTILTIERSDFEQLEENLIKLKSYYPVLGYDDWLSVMFATASEIGDQAAALLLPKYWPEEHTGEYLAHLRGRDASRSPTQGTIVHMIRLHEPNYMKKGLDKLESRMEELTRKLKDA